jgi:hypothetical protein
MIDPMGSSTDIGAYRSQLVRILQDPEFSGSHRLSQFLSFISEAAFAGRDHLEQSEIAAAVLENKEEFNPLDDASVRKMATLTRQKLTKYYAENGRNDAMIVTLPVRCYVPQFQLRGKSPGAGLQGAVASVRHGVWKWVVLAAALASVGIAALPLWRTRTAQSELQPRFQIASGKGDVMHRLNEVAPGAIQLGPKLGAFEDVTARMVFTAEVANQQAGIMVFENPDRYVKLARHFNTRTQLEFGLESGGRYQKTPETFSYDFSGQNGAPIWLSIRRQENRFRAFVSSDGLSWRQLAGVLEMNEPMPNARLAIFAFNGPSEAPSATATFDHVSVGVNFHSTEGQAQEYLGGWTISDSCGPEGHFVIMPDRLSVLLPPIQRRCAWRFYRPLPVGDWSYVTLLDFESQNASYAGLRLSGKNGEIRLIRWDLNGGVISLDHWKQASRRDYPGRPPVYLRLDAKAGRVSAGFSRDGETFDRFPGSIPLDDLGPDVRIGPCAGLSSWSGEERFPPANFFYVRQELQTVTPFR